MARATITLDCGRLLNPSLATVDGIARLQLAVRRRGCKLRLDHADGQLLDLIEFAGLADALGVETSRQAEQREKPVGVEEEG